MMLTWIPECPIVAPEADALYIVCGMPRNAFHMALNYLHMRGLH